jgi:DNA repair exonuclease SbcCD ATPase subunit
MFIRERDFSGTRLAVTLGDRSYNTLSGGEKQIVDLCTGLAIRATAELYNKSHCNLIVLDEPFDSLSATYKSRAQELLSAVAKPSTFVISHGDIDIDFDRMYVVEKKQGWSQLRRIK